MRARSMSETRLTWSGIARTRARRARMRSNRYAEFSPEDVPAQLLFLPKQPLRRPSERRRRRRKNRPQNSQPSVSSSAVERAQLSLRPSCTYGPWFGAGFHAKSGLFLPPTNSQFGRLFALYGGAFINREPSMILQLLESKHEKKGRSAGGTIFSILLHSLIIFLAIFATARAGTS